MKLEHLIVGINFSKADEFLCKYVDFLATKIPINTINNLFVFTIRNLFMNLQNDEHDKTVKLFLKSFEKNMEENLKGFYPHVKNVNYFAVADLYSPAVLHFLVNKKSELIFIGKTKDSSGEMAKLTIRHIPAQVMVVPEQAKHKLDKILVALDESKFSETVLRRALELASKITPRPEVTCMFISHINYFMELEKAISEGYHSVKDKILTAKSKEIFEEEKKAFEKFVSEYSRDFDLKINTKVVFEPRPKPHLALMDYLNENETDLVVLGDRNHSGLNIRMLSGFTERIITENNKTPMLVVK
ncbi:MAG: universal stress protein [Chlorobi bacterium]|nr:universal stress protein [Chlorobiota bacterium]